ncbi:MAG: hypothetical protein U9O98_00805 [Asgard group archaeon]|nr:hypothetical protein [Asgard group archaeon]
MLEVTGGYNAFLSTTHGITEYTAIIIKRKINVYKDDYNDQTGDN